MENKLLLQVNNASVRVEDKEILHHVNLCLGAGETHVLMGPNGTGKSTLGYTLAGNGVNDRNDYVVSDMSYVRLKNLEIGYSLPQKWMKRMGIGGIRLAISGQNLWSTNNMKAQSIDPEQDNENQYPLTRNISFSVQLKL